MENISVKLECLRLAIEVKRAEGDRSAEGIAHLQKFFYNLVSSEDFEREPHQLAAKAKHGKRQKEDDLLS
ncbi:hypothetical protein UFOVP158_7 [uncultured Caudovirales phage]|uniref:Uncharacterized protein n=1 Tax=uncultured Caudovirales phage TaxID=2100421 RepID=A0A6J7WD81_9CAUD|nr:hypothetical protein UFOVP158_7 [uncultured Caudovirales phage]